MVRPDSCYITNFGKLVGRIKEDLLKPAITKDNDRYFIEADNEGEGTELTRTNYKPPSFSRGGDGEDTEDDIDVIDFR